MEKCFDRLMFYSPATASCFELFFLSSCILVKMNPPFSLINVQKIEMTPNM